MRMLAASTAPSAPPAPTIVWTSSIKRTTSFDSTSSLTSFRSLSSNSPRYFVPATRFPMLSWTTRFPLRISGTSPATTFWASPSTIAVFPTPGSPIKTGLFFVLLERIWIRRWISFVRPITGSKSRFLAISVRSIPSESRVGVRERLTRFEATVGLSTPACPRAGPISPPDRVDEISSLTLCISSPIAVRTWAATPSPSARRPRRMCSVPT